MRVKNHMAMWILWFLWFLCVEYSPKRLYKPLCAFLVFVDLVWFLCGSFCGFWSRVVFGSGLRVRSTSCGFCGSVVLPSMPTVARPLVRIDADAYPWSCASTCPPRCMSVCPWSLWTAKKICPSPRFVLCSVSSSLGATFTNGENDHG